MKDVSSIIVALCFLAGISSGCDTPRSEVTVKKENAERLIPGSVREPWLFQGPSCFISMECGVVSKYSGDSTIFYGTDDGCRHFSFLGAVDGKCLSLAKVGDTLRSAFHRDSTLSIYGTESFHEPCTFLHDLPVKVAPRELFALHFYDDGRVFLLVKNRYMFFSPEGELKSEHSFDPAKEEDFMSRGYLSDGSAVLVSYVGRTSLASEKGFSHLYRRMGNMGLPMRYSILAADGDIVLQSPFAGRRTEVYGYERNRINRIGSIEGTNAPRWVGHWGREIFCIVSRSSGNKFQMFHSGDNGRNWTLIDDDWPRFYFHFDKPCVTDEGLILYYPNGRVYKVYRADSGVKHLVFAE